MGVGGGESARVRGGEGGEDNLKIKNPVGDGIL